MATRFSVADFQAAVNARTGVVPGHVWSAVLNPADNATLLIKLNGVTVWKVFWPGSSGAAVTDAAAGNTDTVNIYGADNTSFCTTAAQQFINSLN